MRHRIYFFLSVVGIVLPYSFGLLNPPRMSSMWGELGPIELVGEAALFIALVVFAMAFVASRGQGNQFGSLTCRRNVFFLLLALLLFVCLGEEMSWGQHVFGWETPEFLLAANYQAETNLHNVGVSHPVNPDGTPRAFLPSLITLNRLYAIFILTYGVLIPVAAKVSRRLRAALRRVRLPLAPMWVCGLFATNLVVVVLMLDVGIAPPLVHEAFAELKESLFAVAFAAMAFQQLREVRRGRPKAC